MKRRCGRCAREWCVLRAESSAPTSGRTGRLIPVVVHCGDDESLLRRSAVVLIPVGRSLGKVRALRYDRIIRKRGHTRMHVDFKNSSLLILAITAVVCSRIMFAFFHDPEGPNLLVVTGMAAVIYLVSSAVYLSNIYPSLTGFKRSSAALLIQTFIATGFYLALR